MSDIEYHVVITCPLDWELGTAHILATRLMADELPNDCGVYVYRLEDGRLASQTVVHERPEYLDD